MIARLLRWLWAFAMLVAAFAAIVAIHIVGPRIGPWAAALLGVSLVLALHPFAIACNFIVSRIVSGPVPEAFRLSLVRAVAMLDAEVDASARGVWLATPFLERRPAPVSDESRATPILFVHGYFCNRAVWHSFMKDAAGRGYPCEAVTLVNPFAAIDTQATAIDHAIRAMSRSGGPVFIVAHSMGGLVVRAAMRGIDPQRVAHVVTLGSPHRGTWTARFGSNAALRQMRLASPWLEALAHDEEAGAGLRRSALSSIYSVHDDIVFPPSNACLEGAENIAIGGCGHVALLYDRRVRSIVFDRLDRIAV